MEPRVLEGLLEELTGLEQLSVWRDPADLERFSRDAYDYSPVLLERLRSCRADLVVRPESVAAVMAVAAACARHQVPLTLRGAGTGNYGQCVPLEGGVVMVMTALNRVRAIEADSGVVEVESGCLLKELDQSLGACGRQLRLLPSTWRSASVGGFIAGGSGGIGSVRWGFLRDPGHLLGLELVTLEPDPRLLRLDGADAEALNHAYGTNGILTALQLATAPRVPWQEVSIDCDDWGDALQLATLCQRSALELHLCTLLDRSIVDRLPPWSGLAGGRHRLLLLVAPDGVATLERLAARSNAIIVRIGAEAAHRGNGLRELSWNHTTLHCRSAEPGWTYLQMLLPQPEQALIEALRVDWGDDLLWHLEGVRHWGGARLAALPLVRWRGVEALDRLMAQCRSLGAVLFNPHVLTVEDGGLGVIDGDQVAAKARFDPKGLLNPGKLRGWTG